MIVWFDLEIPQMFAVYAAKTTVTDGLPENIYLRPQIATTARMQAKSQIDQELHFGQKLRHFLPVS